MNKETILITGGAGFIGSNFIPIFLDIYSNYQIINLDTLTYAGNINNLQEIHSHEGYTFIKGDIGNRQFILDLFKEQEIQHVIHFAAESHVDNSIKNPNSICRNKYIRNTKSIRSSKKYWLEKPFVYKQGYTQSRFHHISTDEVYGTLGSVGYFTETTPMRQTVRIVLAKQVPICL